MAWRVEFTRTAEKQIRKLDRQAQARIIRYFKERVQPSENPRQFGKALHGEKQGLWRYRIGDYRAVCQIQDVEGEIVLLALGHRKQVYR